MTGRHAKLTPFARRVTPVEVAQHWFRRGADFSPKIHATYPDFPKAGPDGLFLLTHIETWFDRLHGRKQSPIASNESEEGEAMRAANGQ